MTTALAIQEDPHRFARERRTDGQLAEYVGDKHFDHKHRAHWWTVRRTLVGCHVSTPKEILDELAAVGQGEQAEQLTAEVRRTPVERRLHQAVIRQHERTFDRLCAYLAWLCEVLLPRVLIEPQRNHLENRKHERLGWRCEILHQVVPLRPDLPQTAQERIEEDRRDLIRITRAILKDSELRAGLLALYFLCPRPVRSTRSDKVKRRPLFHALNDICLHWQKRYADDFQRVLDVLAWNYEEFKDLKDKHFATALFSRGGLDFDKWCGAHNREQDYVVRQLNRAMTDDLRLRKKRPRSR